MIGGVGSTGPTSKDLSSGKRPPSAPASKDTKQQGVSMPVQVSSGIHPTSAPFTAVGFYPNRQASQAASTTQAPANSHGHFFSNSTFVDAHSDLIVTESGIRAMKYAPLSQFDLHMLTSLHRSSQHDPDVVVQIEVAREFLSVKNPAFGKRCLWGTACYTLDSDLVCVLHHMGYLSLNHAPPDVSELRVLLRLSGLKRFEDDETSDPKKPSPPESRYFDSSEQNFLRSRSWLQSDNAAYMQVLDVVGFSESALKSSRGKVVRLASLESARLVLGSVVTTFAPPFHKQGRLSGVRGRGSEDSESPKRARKSKPVSPFVEPELSQSFLPEVRIVYSLSNEPCLRYSLLAIGDRGIHPSSRTSFRLRNEVLMLETLHHRFELSQITEAHQESEQNATEEGNESIRPALLYNFVRVLNPHRLSMYSKSQYLSRGLEHDSDLVQYGLDLEYPESIPLAGALDCVEVEGTNLSWNALLWSDEGLRINSTLYPIIKFAFIPRTHSAQISPT